MEKKQTKRKAAQQKTKAVTEIKEQVMAEALSTLLSSETGDNVSSCFLWDEDKKCAEALSFRNPRKLLKQLRDKTSLLIVVENSAAKAPEGWTEPKPKTRSASESEYDEDEEEDEEESCAITYKHHKVSLHNLETAVQEWLSHLEEPLECVEDLELDPADSDSIWLRHRVSGISQDSLIKVVCFLRHVSR